MHDEHDLVLLQLEELNRLGIDLLAGDGGGFDGNVHRLGDHGDVARAVDQIDQAFAGARTDDDQGVAGALFDRALVRRDHDIEHGRRAGHPHGFGRGRARQRGGGQRDGGQGEHLLHGLRSFRGG